MSAPTHDFSVVHDAAMQVGNVSEQIEVKGGAPLLETETFDLLLTDIVMPEMDGIELAQKAGEMCKDLRVMFITGFAAVTLKAGRAMPQARVLSKPFHLRDLVAEVDRLFEMDNVTGMH